MPIFLLMRNFITSALLAFITVGCAGTAQQTSSDPVDIVEPGSNEIEAMNQKLMANASGAQEPGDYLLGSGDLIEVTVFEDEELNTTVRVSARGFIRLPLLNQVQVQGLTVRETEALVELLYQKDFMRDPHVSLFVKEHFSQRIALVGQLKNPGTYDYLTKQRLIDVLALAGGLSEDAGTTAQIRHKNPAQGEPETIIVDLDRLIQDGKIALNIEINGGDTIFVPEAGVYYVDGAVRKPGNYSIKHHTNIREALLATGGFMPYADKSILQLIRYVGDGQREIINLDLDENQWEEMQVQDRDVIIATTSAWGKFINGVGLNLGGGLLGVGVGYKSPER